MGSGSSKNNEVTKFEDDSDDDDWSEKPAKKDDNHGKPAEKEETRKKESTFLGGVFSKNKEAAAPSKLPTRKIVGESSSSSEDEDEYYKDVQLRRDIHQLERALNNVDTKSDLRQTRPGVSAPLPRHEGLLPGLPARGVESANTDQIQLSRHGQGQRKRSDLKFSWDERDRGQSSEDWSLQKVNIEGFDPAKFKAANKTGASDSSSRTNLRSISLGTTQASTIRTIPSLSEPPGFVPTYDHSEQQLLASLERELGV